MADVIHVERGFSPWQPAPDAHLVKEYQYYEVPTRGVIEQHGIRYFFACLAGADDTVSAWIYIRIDPKTEARLDASAFEEFDTVGFDGPAVMALAVEGPGVVAIQVLDELIPDYIRSAHRALYEEMQVWAQEAKNLEPAPA